MSHKDEAEILLHATMVDHLDPGEDLSVDEALMLIQAKAILALVDAQEARTEQARIANLIALWQGSVVKAEYVGEGEDGLFTAQSRLRPHIATALAIGDAE